MIQKAIDGPALPVSVKSNWRDAIDILLYASTDEEVGEIEITVEHVFDDIVNPARHDDVDEYLRLMESDQARQCLTQIVRRKPILNPSPAASSRGFSL